MTSEAEREENLQREILRRLDSTGEFTQLLEVFKPVMRSRVARWVISRLGVDVRDLDDALSQSDGLLGSMAQSIIFFAPHGWAPSGQVPAEIYESALQVFRSAESIEDAEAHLVEGWNAGDRLLWMLKRVKTLGVGEEDLRSIAHERARLLDKALEHHRAGAYEASVPIVLAQIDGVVHDFTDPPISFFSQKMPSAPLEDETTIAGMVDGLVALRAVFGEGIHESGSCGSLSRHGVMHGRELGYDTVTNSTKCFVLLAAVIEWAQPLARAEAERRQHDREQRYAGSDGVDEHGRRLDARGFVDARSSLRFLSTAQMGRWRNHDHYGSDLHEMFPGDTGERLLHGRDEVALQVTDDGREFWAWRRSASGWCFGIAGRDGPPNEYFYAGPEPPAGGIDSGADWRGLVDPLPPDWETS